MQYKLIKRPVRTKEGYMGEIKFEGRPLGRSTGRKIDFDLYCHATEIYQLRGDGFLIYVFYRGGGGDLQLANFTEACNLDIGEIRAALKDSDIYPGPHFSRAVYNSFDTLQLLEKILE